MRNRDLKERTKSFSIEVIRFSKSLPFSPEYNVIQHQIIKSASSVGANYRASQRAKSTPDFINKLKIVEEELDETIYWLEIIFELDNEPENKAVSLLKEAHELLAIIVTSIKTARSNRGRNSR